MVLYYMYVQIDLAKQTSEDGKENGFSVGVVSSTDNLTNEKIANNNPSLLNKYGDRKNALVPKLYNMKHLYKG